MNKINKLTITLALMALALLIITHSIIGYFMYRQGSEDAYNTLFSEECTLNRSSMTVICDSYYYEGSN